MSTLPAIEGRASWFVDEPGDGYLRLLAASRQVAAEIVKTPVDTLSGSPKFVHQASRALLELVTGDSANALESDGAIFEFLRRVLAAWPELAAGRIDGENLLAGDPLWKAIMTEWPMGGFARMAADVLIDNNLLCGTVMELGAGVGSGTALVASHVNERFIRTDLLPFLLKRQHLPGIVERYDFNEPGRWRDLDTIFAINALHCSRDKCATLRHLFKMLRVGGVLILAEGRPRTDFRGTPWALTPYFGLFRGWWDIGGYLEREAWVAALKAAGFGGIGFSVRRAGTHDLGGVIWALKQDSC